MMSSYRYAGLRLWARLLLRLERHDAAMAVFQEMAAMRPDDDYPLASQAHLLTLMKRPQEALALLTGLTKSHPKVGAHWFNLGFLQDEAAQYEQAYTSFEQATALNPEIDRAWYGLGLVAIRLRRWDEALAALKHNTKLQPMSLMRRGKSSVISKGLSLRWPLNWNERRACPSLPPAEGLPEKVL
jgi:tetratricopeptide (TPR) repeat protein